MKTARILSLGLLLIAGAACAGQNLRLAVPDTTPAQRYTCRVGKGCEPASTDVPDNPSGTLFFIVPRQCRGLVNEILVRDAGSSDALVTVVCAPAEPPLGEMQGEPPKEQPLEEMR